MLAVIPARGGSKGLPGKNIKELSGKPLIAYTIEAALNAENISRVIVSTDCQEIAAIAKKYGAEVPFIRPAFLATDKAKSIDVFRHLVDTLGQTESNFYKELVILQPTSPLRDSADIDKAIDLFKQKNAKSVISFCQETHPIFWNKYIDENARFENVFTDEFIKNRQEIRPTFRPNGAIYVFDVEILDSGNYYSADSYAYVMDSNKSVDIDTIDDFEYAEFLISKR